MLRIQREQYLQLLRERKKRREKDPLDTFSPFFPQTDFIHSVLYNEHEEDLYVGANRSGKSQAGAYLVSRLLRRGYPDDSPLAAKPSYGPSCTVRDRAISAWVSALDYPTSRDTIQPKMFDNGYCPPGGAEPFIPEYEIDSWNENKQILRLKNGSLCGFKSADSGRKKFQGAEKDIVLLDEEHPQNIYEEVKIRVGARPLKICHTCTLLPPEGQVGGITWMFTQMIQPWKKGLRPELGIYNASIYQNPHIPRTEIDKLESVYPPGSVQRRIRLDGELIPGLAGARVYAGFSHELNVREQTGIATRRPLCWMWDFNVEPMITLVGQQDGLIFRVFAELVLDEGNISEMCDFFKMRFPSHLAEIKIYGDATGKERSHQTKRSSYNIILTEMRSYASPCRLYVPECNPSIVDRINAVNYACKNELDEICLEVAPDCLDLIDDLDQVVTDGKGGIKKTTNRKDPYYRRTHASDALGYWINFEAPIKPLSLGDRRGLWLPRNPGYSLS